MKSVVGNVDVAQSDAPENTNHQTWTENRFIDKVRRLRLKYDNVCLTLNQCGQLVLLSFIKSRSCLLW